MITRFEIGKSANQFAGSSIRRYRYVIELDNAVNVEKILELAEDFQFVTLGKIKKTRVTLFRNPCGFDHQDIVESRVETSGRIDQPAEYRSAVRQEANRNQVCFTSTVGQLTAERHSKRKSQVKSALPTKAVFC